ncbi:DnaD domain protein [Bacillus sp. V5-8f]|uniref:DnaD domain protein n=1 Tax=Bacillus sp. V5-8f TaxID=2053044 RepID=UPI000C76EC5E|nr:DnaD domain protein [Bacillus sp. V5-8f]PLT33512.1 hypothetical protein CUU64_13140 [Bacillus sp. V5-8f]
MEDQNEVLKKIIESQPEVMLKNLNNYNDLSIVDYMLIQSLRERFQFSDGVINILLQYVKEEVDPSLQWMYIEKIAINWLRANIQTVEQALEAAKVCLPTKTQVEPSLILEYIGSQLDYKVNQLVEMYKTEESKEYASIGIEILSNILSVDLLETYHLK